MSATVLTATAATSTFSVSATSPRVGSTALESDYLTDGESSPQSMECQRSSSSSVAFCDQDSNQGDRYNVLNVREVLDLNTAEERVRIGVTYA